MWHVMIISICPRFSSTSLYCLSVSHSPSTRTVNSDLKRQRRSINQPFLFLYHLPSFPSCLAPFSSVWLSALSLIHLDFRSLLDTSLSSIYCPSPLTSWQAAGRQPERKSEGIRLGLKCNIRLLKRLVVKIPPIWATPKSDELAFMILIYVPRLLYRSTVTRTAIDLIWWPFMRHLVTGAIELSNLRPGCQEWLFREVKFIHQNLVGFFFFERAATRGRVRTWLIHVLQMDKSDVLNKLMKASDGTASATKEP